MTISNVDLQKKFDKRGINITAIIMANELRGIPLQKSMNIIINLDDRGNNGTHWTCMCVRGKEAFYFDSYGAKCDKYVLDYCKRHNLKLGINTYIIQDLDSVECGLFCFAYILYLHKEKIPNKITREFPKSRLYELSNNFINMFEHDTRLNDNILFDYIR